MQLVFRILATGTIATSLLFLALPGCGSGKETAVLSVEDRFQKAKSLFDDGDYLEAYNEFTVITLQFAGSAQAGEAQYYLGECRIRRGEYLLAVFEYSTLKRNMPASPFVADAQYKIGLCYYNLSPKSSLDQKYTKNAIDEFQAFVEYYPSHQLAADASAKIAELTDRLAKKQFDTAQLYQRMEYFKAAQFYYEDVIEKYHDTPYAPPAYIGKVEVLIARKKFQDASVDVDRFLERFPQSPLRARALDLKQSIENELKRPKDVTGKDSGSSLLPDRRSEVTSERNW